MQNLSSQDATAQPKVSIWHRPIHVPFVVWKTLAALSIVCAIVTLACPYAYGAIVWVGHRTVTYCGLSIPLPFGWLEQKEDPFLHDWLNVEKPSWQSAVVNSNLTVHRNGYSAKQVDQWRSAWLHLHRQSGMEEIGTNTRDGFQTDDGHPLLCSELPLTRFIMLSCLSNDAYWTFDYIGSASDSKRANQIARHILSHESELNFRPLS